MYPKKQIKGGHLKLCSWFVHIVAECTSRNICAMSQ